MTTYEFAKSRDPRALVRSVPVYILQTRFFFLLFFFVCFDQYIKYIKIQLNLT